MNKRRADKRLSDRLKRLEEINAKEAEEAIKREMADKIQQSRDSKGRFAKKRSRQMPSYP